MVLRWIGVSMVLGLAPTGCYAPAIEACRLACSDSRCPAGLTCNAQGLCATSASEVCSAPPTDGSELGDVIVEVRDAEGQPFGNARVLFVDRQGVTVDDVLTGSEGTAMARMESGGNATVIRTIFGPGEGAEVWVTTFVDLPPAAHVISAHTVDRERTRPVELHWTPHDDAQQYDVYTSCVGLSSAMTTRVTLAVPTTCPRFDVVVIGRDSTGAPIGTLALGDQTGPAVELANAWVDPTTRGGMLDDAPTNAAATQLSIGGSLTAGVPHVPSLVSLFPSSTGDLGTLPLPRDMQLVSAVALARVPDTDSPAQVVIDHPEASETRFVISLDGKVLPWVTPPATSLATNTLRWSVAPPANVTPAEPAFVVATMSYRRKESNIHWRLVAPAHWITDLSGDARELVFPDVPGTQPFEPPPGDTVLDGEVALHATNPAAADAWRMTAEVATADDDPFDVPGLMWATLSVSHPHR